MWNGAAFYWSMLLKSKTFFETFYSIGLIIHSIVFSLHCQCNQARKQFFHTIIDLENNNYLTIHVGYALFSTWNSEIKQSCYPYMAVLQLFHNVKSE